MSFFTGREAEHMRFLKAAWVFAIVGLLFNFWTWMIGAILFFVLAYLNTPEEVEIYNEQSLEAEEAGQ